MDSERLLAAAKRAADLAYAPYSHFRVGAAILCDDGTVVTGCNVENRSFGLTICAERNAVAKALSEGKSKFDAIAVVCPDSDAPVPPCGACRQVLSEFSDGSLLVVYQGSASGPENARLDDLLPRDSLKDLKDRI